MQPAYEMAVGLEVHVELATESKIFCACPTAVGAPPNTQCCPVCSGMPGALPVLNKKVVEYALTAGLAMHCTVNRASMFDRKHYFYPDLPKGYQISQCERPLCENGYVTIGAGALEKRVEITRIHIEEDAGKLIHHPAGTLVDLNRSGVPLIEIVSAPQMRSAGEAAAFLRKIRAIVLYTGVSDAKMNEGSLRCDVNLSVRRAGERRLGARVEIKNLNSFSHVEKAIAYEYNRQVKMLRQAAPIVRETRRFDAKDGGTHALREKQGAADYRVLPEPDLPCVCVSEKTVARLKAALPVLPDERRRRYEAECGLSAAHSEMLAAHRPMADLFEEACRGTAHTGPLAALVMGEVFRLSAQSGGEIRVSARQLAEVVNLWQEGTLHSGGAKELLAAVWWEGGEPRETAARMRLAQQNDAGVLRPLAEKLLAQNPGMATDYRRGKKAALKALMGLGMAQTKGRANPALLARILEELLANAAKKDE